MNKSRPCQGQGPGELSRLAGVGHAPTQSVCTGRDPGPRPQTSADLVSLQGLGTCPKAPVRFPPLGVCYNYWVSSQNASEVSDVIQTFPPSLVYFCPISIRLGRGSVKEAWKRESWMSLGSAAPSSPAPTMTQRVLRPAWCMQRRAEGCCARVPVKRQCQRPTQTRGGGGEGRERPRICRARRA